MTSELNLWNLDDVTLGETADAVLHELQTIIESAVEIGLEFNLSECDHHIFEGDLDKQQEVLKNFMDVFDLIVLI